MVDTTMRAIRATTRSTDTGARVTQITAHPATMEDGIREVMGVTTRDMEGMGTRRDTSRINIDEESERMEGKKEQKVIAINLQAIYAKEIKTRLQETG